MGDGKKMDGCVVVLVTVEVGKAEVRGDKLQRMVNGDLGIMICQRHPIGIGEFIRRMI